MILTSGADAGEQQGDPRALRRVRRSGQSDPFFGGRECPQAKVDFGGEDCPLESFAGGDDCRDVDLAELRSSRREVSLRHEFTSALDALAYGFALYRDFVDAWRARSVFAL